MQEAKAAQEALLASYKAEQAGVQNDAAVARQLQERINAAVEAKEAAERAAKGSSFFLHNNKDYEADNEDNNPYPTPAPTPEEEAQEAREAHNRTKELHEEMEADKPDEETVKRAAKASTVTLHKPTTEVDSDFIIPDKENDRGGTPTSDVKITAHAVEVTPLPDRSAASVAATDGANDEPERSIDDIMNEDLPTEFDESSADRSAEEAEVPEDNYIPKEETIEADSNTTTTTSHVTNTLKTTVSKQRKVTFVSPPRPKKEEEASVSETTEDVEEVKALSPFRESVALMVLVVGWYAVMMGLNEERAWLHGSGL